MTLQRKIENHSLLLQLAERTEELEKLKSENRELRKCLKAFSEASNQKNASLLRENRRLTQALGNEVSKRSHKLGELLSSALMEWHAPFSLPLKLCKLWAKEMLAYSPRHLGGSSYNKVISAYEYGGMKEVEKLLNSKPLPPVIVGNAYTALSRALLMKKSSLDATEAARRAFEADPKYFRMKWLAFRLNGCEDAKGAAEILSFLQGKIPFSDSEVKLGSEINRKATLDEDYKRRVEFSSFIESLRDDDPIQNWEQEIDLDELSVKNADLINICRQDGCLSTFRALRKKIGDSPWLLALKLLQLAWFFHTEDPQKEYLLARAAVRMDPCPANLRILFWISQNARRFMEGLESLRRYERALLESGDRYDRQMLDKMRSCESIQLNLLFEAQNALAPRHTRGIEKRICYIIHNSLPWSGGGYATRSHGIAKGLQKQGYEVICLTRPGYPWDLRKMSEGDREEVEEVVDGVPYRHLREPVQKGMKLDEYMRCAAEKWINTLRTLKPEIVIAASNYVTGLPAMIACRRLGIPFVYEVRGLWEITRMSKERGFEKSESFHIQRIFEAGICGLADHVFTLTGELKAELIRRGVEAAKISLIPNACDTEKFSPAARDRQLARKYHIPKHVPVIGYIGTFTTYEGLDLLLRACALLKARGCEFRLLMVGNENASGMETGPITGELKRIAQENAFADWLIMPGRIPFSQSAAHYSLVDVAPFPRMPWPVCEMVSPIKPLEAMSMGKAVLVSSVNALKEMVKDGENALVFSKGDVGDLAVKLENLLHSPELRQELGNRARAYVAAERSWERAGKDMIRELEKLSHNASESVGA